MGQRLTVLESLIFGLSIPKNLNSLFISKTGLIKLLPTLLPTFQQNLAPQEVWGKGCSIGFNWINLTVYQDLLKLHKAEIEKSLDIKKSNLLLPNQSEKLVIEKSKTSEQLLITENKKQNRKKRSGE